jgi:lipopolysaccharide biosynthesis regulator YciM
VSAFSGWLVARYGKKDEVAQAPVKSLPSAYFRGLNFLLNEQSDDAIDAFKLAVGHQSDSAEVQLSLGNLYRRRGEIEKATQLHENLLRITKQDRELHSLALYELAQDYQKAGLLDRAENLYLELIETGHQTQVACMHLLQIYEQEKDWSNAISVIESHLADSNETVFARKSHYYCELAELSITEGRFNDAGQFLGRAFDSDSGNLRAIIQSGRIEAAMGHHQQAMHLWKQVVEKNSLFVREVIEHIANAYRALNDEKGLDRYLSNVIEKHKSSKAMLLLTDNILKHAGKQKAEERLAGWLRKNPSISGLSKLLEIKLDSSSLNATQRRDLVLLSRLLDSVTKSQLRYQCRQCGFSGRHFYWHCPSCRSWNSITAQRTVLG